MPATEYLCSYTYEGDQWSTSVHAESRDEARLRLRSIGMTGQVDGELVARIPVYPGTGLMVRIWVFFRNLTGARHD